MGVLEEQRRQRRALLGADVAQKAENAEKTRYSGELAAGNFGGILGRQAARLAGELGFGEDSQYLAGNIGQNMGDAAGGALRAFSWAGGAEQAADQAGALAEARNERARTALMGDAGTAADAMNLRNTARTAEMTDSSIGRAGAFESGMRGIDMSGIEGSGNMERNLQYGMSRGEAERQLQYDMMSAEARGLGDSMARSFSELSQGKAGAMTAAWGNSVGGNRAALTRQYEETGKAVMGAQPSLREIEDAQNTPAEAEEQAAPRTAAEQAVQPETAVEQAVQPRTAAEQAVQPETAAEQAVQPETAGQAAVSSDQYRQIYDYVKGGVSSEALAGKLSELGIRDHNIIKAVQDATANGKTKGRAGWSTALRDALGLKDAAVLLD